MVQMARKLAELTPNPKNPRKVTHDKLKALEKALKQFGDMSGIVFNRRTGNLVGGTQRTGILPKDAELSIIRRYKSPTKRGTVCEGEIKAWGEWFKYREVDWSEQIERAASIAANKGAGEWDYELLSEWFQDLVNDPQFDLDLTLFDQDERKGFFSDLFDDEDEAEKEKTSVEGFRDTIKVKCPKALKPQVVELLMRTIAKSKYADVVEIVPK